MSTIAILVHGFNVWDGGRATVGKLRPFFANQGVPYIMLNYGWFGIGRTYVKNMKIAKRLAEACHNSRHRVDQKIVVVSHSNGAAITYLAAKHYGAPIDRAVFINPALDRDIILPRSIKTLDVWYSPGDEPVKISRKLPFHPWGDMGAQGYRGPPDRRIRSINKQDFYPVSSAEHSDVFDLEKLSFFGPLIAEESLADPDVKE